MSKEAMKLALEQRITDYLSAGGLFNPELADHLAVRDLLIDCRKALAEPDFWDGYVPEPVKPAQQEPVAWMLDGEFYKTQQFHLQGGHYANQIPLYTPPPAQRTWVGLTNKDVYECEPKKDWYDSVEFARAIEAKLRSKNEDRN